MTDLSDLIARALEGINSDDALTSLVSWHRLQKAGLAESLGNGRYLSFQLNSEGKAALKARSQP